MNETCVGHFDDFEYFKNSLIYMALIFAGVNMFFRILRILHYNNLKIRNSLYIYMNSGHFRENSILASIYDEPKFLFVALCIIKMFWCKLIRLSPLQSGGTRWNFT